MSPEMVGWAMITVGLFIVWAAIWFVLGAVYGMRVLREKVVLGIQDRGNRVELPPRKQPRRRENRRVSP